MLETSIVVAVTFLVAFLLLLGVGAYFASRRDCRAAERERADADTRRQAAEQAIAERRRAEAEAADRRRQEGADMFTALIGGDLLRVDGLTWRQDGSFAAATVRKQDKEHWQYLTAGLQVQKNVRASSTTCSSGGSDVPPSTCADRDGETRKGLTINVTGNTVTCGRPTEAAAEGGEVVELPEQLKWREKEPERVQQVERSSGPAPAA